jgi:hypothetical protein
VLGSSLMGLSVLFHKMQLLESRNPEDLKLWVAATQRIHDLTRLEKGADGDGGRRFEIEKTMFIALQRRLRAMCSGNRSEGIGDWVSLRQSVRDPIKWNTQTKPAILEQPCAWFAFDDSTCVPIPQTAGLMDRLAASCHVLKKRR